MTEAARSASSGEDQIVTMITNLHPHRSRRLFTEFLPHGYVATALSKPTGIDAPGVLRAKILLGSLITFQDDLADHPKYYDMLALDYLYGQSPTLPLDPRSRLNVLTSEAITRELWSSMRGLRHFTFYEALMRFDLDQIAGANRFSGLQRQYSGLSNLTESKHFGPFNMGMVAAGTIDLMSLGPQQTPDFAMIREATYLGQRAGRISNVAETLQREASEGDLSNEALIATSRGHDQREYLAALAAERKKLIADIRRLGHEARAIDLDQYATGIETLHGLHLAYERDL